MDTPPIIQLADATVVKSPGVRVLDRVSMTVHAGEHTAILGPNGSGKSSLIKLLALLHYPLVHPDGSPPVLLFGRERWNVFDLRQRLGIVSPELQQTFTDPAHGRLRGLEAVVSGFFASYGLFEHQAITPEMWASARRALAQIGALALADKPLRTLSTGEARRILIARALVFDPQALLLDEPTTGLDLVAMARFLETLQALARRGKTVVLVTHRVEEIFSDIERVVLLRGGRVFADGAKRDVLTSENLSAVYDAPIDVRLERNGYYTASSSVTRVGG